MYATLYAPDFHLQAATLADGGADPYQPAALLDRSLSDVEKLGEKAAGKALVLEANEAAQVMGVRVGMTAAQAQARFAALTLRYRSAENEAALRARFLAIADRFTPDYEDTAPGTCTLDLIASAFGRDASGGSRRFAGEAVRACEDERLEARIGVARHPDLSLLAARLATAAEPRMLLDDGAEQNLRRQLDAMLVDVLAPPPEIRAVLRLWGIGTLGELTALSRDAITARLGTGVLPLWTLARGGAPRLLRLVRTPEAFEQRIDFEHEVATFEPLLFPIRRVIETLVARLAAVWFVARRIDLDFLGHDGAPVCRAALRIPEPCRDVEVLFQRVHRHLETLAVDRPVAAMWLRIDPARAGSHQFHLFESGLRDPNRFAETLAQIEALLGSERVGIPSYAPVLGGDNARVVPFDEQRILAVQAGRQGGPAPGAAAGLPFETAIGLGPRLRRFRPPRPVFVQIAPNGEPVEMSGPSFAQSLPLCQMRGPWLHSGGWWHPPALWKSREWDVQARGEILFRLSCRAPGWFSDGVYG